MIIFAAVDAALSAVQELPRGTNDVDTAMSCLPSLWRHSQSSMWPTAYHVGRSFESPIWLPVRTLSLIVRMTCLELFLKNCRTLCESIADTLKFVA